jgi:hypothetical protein
VAFKIIVSSITKQISSVIMRFGDSGVGKIHILVILLMTLRNVVGMYQHFGGLPRLLFYLESNGSIFSIITHQITQQLSLENRDGAI